MFSRDSPEIQSSLRPLSQSEPWGGSMNEEESPLETEHTLAVLLPGGVEITTTVNGSKPVMDLLVSLCAQYHLNPSDFTVELQSANRNDIAFKPSSLIGSMEADRILLKPKGVEEKMTKRPYVPEATVRLLINYKKNHKAVVRVSPRVPLEQLLPSICEKCEFDLESTILLKDNHSDEPLDLTRSLNDHGLRELYAKGPAAVCPEVDLTPPPTEAHAEESGLTVKEKKQKRKQKEKENRGLFSLFRRIKKKPEKEVCVSAPTSSGLTNRCETSISMNSLGVRCSNTLPSKKRQAPLPPIAGSQSVPANLNIQPLTSRKKRAPLPPHCPSPPPQDTEVEGNGVFLYTVEEERGESDELNSSSSTSSPNSSSPLAHPQTPPSVSRFSATLPSSNPNHTSPPTTPSVGEILTPLLLSQTRAKLKQPSMLTPRPASSTNGGSPVSSTQSGAWREVSPLHLLQLKANMLGEAWRSPSLREGMSPGLREGMSPGLREGMTTFTVVPRGQSLRKQRGFEEDLTLDPPKTSEPSQTINRPCDGVPDSAWEDKQAAQQWTEVEATSPKLDVEASPPGIPECSTVCLISPQAVSSTVELYETAPNSPVEENQEELQSPVNTQGCLESVSEVPNPYSTDLFTLTTNIIPGNEVTSTCEGSESTGTFQKTDLISKDESEEGRFSFPPPPTPLCCNKDKKGVTQATQLRVRVPGGRNPSPPSYPPPSPPTQSPSSCALAEGDNVTNSPSLPKPNMIHLTLPTPYEPPAASRPLVRKTAIPSSFAQAVAVAVRKAQSSPQQRAATQPGPSSGSSPSAALPLHYTGSD